MNPVNIFLGRARTLQSEASKIIRGHGLLPGPPRTAYDEIERVIHHLQTLIFSTET